MSGTTALSSTGAISQVHEKMPLPVLLMLIFVLMVPIEFSVSLGPLFLTPSKLFLVLITFVILPKISDIKLRSYDWLMLIHSGWATISFVRTYGMADGIERSGFYVLEFLIVYLVARIYLRTVGQILSVVGFLFAMVALNAILAVPEGITGRRYVHEIGRAITGFYYNPFHEQRMGIWRSMALFEHPILMGVFCSSALSLVWFTSTPQQRMWRVPLIFLGTFFAASSAPLLAFMLQLYLIGIERITRKVKARVAKFSAGVAVLWVVLQYGTNRGFIGFLSLIVLNSHTAYYRRAQWREAIDDVQRHFFFGFDPATFTRPRWMISSIDNNWLLVMMRSGVPSLFMIFATILMIWLALAKRREDYPLFVNLRKGWGLMMIALLVAGATVAFFGKVQPLFSFYIGLGAALANCLVPQTGSDQPEPAPAVPASRYTRFPEKPPAPIRSRGEPTRPVTAGPASGATPIYRRPPTTTRGPRPT
ncbi:hypothetical protein CDV52_09025 [Haematobacter missouriensis]|uniref:O-antigen ligase domain-containing protein n=1 Tax=Haematobacter missouriensis TaxID=366616 RepID=A0A212ARG5_9RHOB|nr:hypothetical protein [Haematobacter missouriensis]OWJ84025.1 hypothetical protein CDV52_09025 [Haematobacter missouriensis]